MLLQFSSRGRGSLRGTQRVTRGDLLFDDAVKQRLNSAAGRTLDVQARSTRAFVGETAVMPRHGLFGGAPQTSEYFSSDMREFAWLSLSASIAADRPEAFAVVRDSCMRLGYDCRAVGLVFASDRARALAQSLGVGVGFISLVAAYTGTVVK